MRFILLSSFILIIHIAQGQRATITGIVRSAEGPVPFASVMLTGTGIGTVTDSTGRYSIKNISPGSYNLHVSFLDYKTLNKPVSLKNGETLTLDLRLTTDSKTLHEVVITGVSKATLIRENPVAIVSVSSKQMQQSAENNLIDALVKNVPGLNAVKVGPNISKPFIRGLGYNRVLTLYDGIRQEGQQWGDEHGIEVDAYNVDKAEVIKGPASLMYGSDALAGVVSFFPFVPNYSDAKLHGRLISEYQTNNQLVGNGLQLGYTTTHFLFALRGSYRLAKNYQNPVDGRVYLTGFNEKNLSAVLGYKTGKGSTLINFTLYDNHQGIPDGSRDSVTRKFTRQRYEGAQDSITNRPVVTDGELNSYAIPALSQHIQHYRMYLHSAYQVGAGDIDFLFALQQNVRREYNHPTLPQQAGMHVRLNTLNYGLRYNAPECMHIETAIGINGMFQNNESKSATDFPIPDYNLFDAGLYLYGKWKQNKWAVSGGLRYDMRRIQWNDFYVRKNSATGFDERVFLPDTTHALLQYPGYAKNFSGLSASLGATYEITPQVYLKFNIGRAYRAPNITEMASNGLDPGAHIIYLGNRNFNPEFSLQEDLGISFRYTDFSGDISLFNNHIQNFIYLNMVADASGQPVTDQQGNKTYQYKQAKAQLYGMEMYAALHPEKLKGLRLDNTLSMVYGFNKNTEYRDKGVQGQYLPFIPPLKIQSSLSKECNIRGALPCTMKPKFEMEYAAAQNRYLGLNNTETATPAYILYNAGISAEMKYGATGAIQCQLQVNNMFNTIYQSNLSRLKYFEYFQASPNGRPGIYNMGRNICFKVIVSF